MCSNPPSPRTPADDVGVTTASWLEPKQETEHGGDDGCGYGFYEDTWPESEWPKEAGTWDHGCTKAEWGQGWEDYGQENYYKCEDEKHEWHGQKYKPTKKDHHGWEKFHGDRRSQSTSSGSSGKGTYVRGGWLSGDGKFFEHGKGRDRDRTRGGRREQQKRAKQTQSHLEDMREALTALHTMARVVERTAR